MNGRLLRMWTTIHSRWRFLPLLQQHATHRKSTTQFGHRLCNHCATTVVQPCSDSTATRQSQSFKGHQIFMKKLFTFAFALILSASMTAFAQDSSQSGQSSSGQSGSSMGQSGSSGSSMGQSGSSDQSGQTTSKKKHHHKNSSSSGSSDSSSGNSGNMGSSGNSGSSSGTSSSGSDSTAKPQ